MKGLLHNDTQRYTLLNPPSMEETFLVPLRGLIGGVQNHSLVPMLCMGM